MSRISATCGASAGGGGAAVKIGGCVIGIISSSDTKDVVEYTTSVSSYVRVVYSKHANIADRATMYPMSKPVPFSFSRSAFGDFFTSIDYIYFLVIISFGAKSCAGSEPLGSDCSCVFSVVCGKSNTFFWIDGCLCRFFFVSGLIFFVFLSEKPIIGMVRVIRGQLNLLLGRRCSCLFPLVCCLLLRLSRATPQKGRLLSLLPRLVRLGLPP